VPEDLDLIHLSWWNQCDKHYSTNL